MSTEHRERSEFSHLKNLADERNASEEWRLLFEIKPSINRIVGLRGRLLGASDVNDIYYDLQDFAGTRISYQDLGARLKKMVDLETTYYPVSHNFGARCALSMGLYERIPDFIDAAKDIVARIVWHTWKPERGEDFISLHVKVMGHLRRHLGHAWSRNHEPTPFSYSQDYILARAKPVNEWEVKSSTPRPRDRLRYAISHLSLPTMVAVIDKAEPLEKIAAFGVMGYYPDGRGFTGIGKEIRVMKETLSRALDRVLPRLVTAQDGEAPQRKITEIVDELLEGAVMRHPSGRNVRRTNPRLKLLQISQLPDGIGEKEREIFELARERRGDTFSYSTEEIAERMELSETWVCRIIKRMAYENLAL